MAGNDLIPGFVATTQPGSNRVIWYNLEQGDGNRFFVHSGTGADTNSGLSPDTPFATIDAAIGACTANNGDFIYVMPGHAETISAAAGIAADVAGITVVGLGKGNQTPTITFDTADTADIDIDAAGVTFENLHFIAGFADIVAAIDVNADDFTLRNCRFTEGTNLNFLVCVQDAAAGGSDRITIEGCHAICPDAANTHFVNFAGTGTGHIIRNNRLMGDWGTMAVGGAGVITYCIIEGNLIYNAASTNDSCINLAATATGMVYNNHCGGAAAQANGVTATACMISQNYYGVLAEDLSGILDPIAT